MPGARPRSLVAMLFLVGCSSSGDTSSSSDPGKPAGPEVINGVTVPKAPDPAANQASVAGVDSDGDGVRDDVQRVIATEFGADAAFHAEAIEYARSQQLAITDPTPAHVSAHVGLVECVIDEGKLTKLRKITTATLDIKPRRAAYGRAFAGVALSAKGCSK